MNPIQLISSLLKGTQSTIANTLPLTPGQVLMGEVKKIHVDQTALIAFGSFSANAKLEVPLELGQRSWFQVQATGQPITLKILPISSSIKQTSEKDVKEILPFFGLKQSPLNEEIVRFFIKERLPIHHSLLNQASHLLQGVTEGKEEILRSIQAVLVKGLPITKEVILSVKNFMFNPPIHQQLQHLLTDIPESQRGGIEAIIPRVSEVENSVPPVLREYFHSLGLQNEKDIFNLFKFREQGQLEQQSLPSNLKLQIQQLIHAGTLSVEAKGTLEGILQHITGQQLFLQSDSQQALVHQILFQLPLIFNKELQTIYGQLEGKRNSQGRIDSENCRVILYLQLQALGETCVDIHIVNNIISVTIFNEKKLEEWLIPVKGRLAEVLSEKGYLLSSLGWKDPTQNKKQGPLFKQSQYSFPSPPYQGVDVRI
jgi:hypothetical protein